MDLVIDNLPTLSGQFLCAFTALDKTLITNATRKSYGVNCTTPRTDQLPSIPPGQLLAPNAYLPHSLVIGAWMATAVLMIQLKTAGMIFLSQVSV
uniref:Plexin TIG domain-containing protein n=1 Tax=Timema cristinae TaxID=61476 RepID=A0A7R9DPH6_TIMCR|nr:unnamed protein product [Timema cristinae]